MPSRSNRDSFNRNGLQIPRQRAALTLNTVVSVQMSCRKYNLSLISHKESGPL